MKLMVVILLLVLACCSLEALENGTGEDSFCPVDWINFQRHCYLLKKKPRTWNDAEVDCQKFGSKSNLASILSEKENKHLASVLAGGNDPGFRIWIGMFRKKQGGRIIQLRWTDNANVDYTNWAEGQPDKSGYCVEIFGDGSYRWDDANCDKENYYMCKMPLS